MAPLPPGRKAHDVRQKTSIFYRASPSALTICSDRSSGVLMPKAWIVTCAGGVSSRMAAMIFGASVVKLTRRAAYVYESQVKEWIATGRLTTVLDNCCETPIRFFFYYPSQRQMPPCLRVFVDTIRR